MDREQEELQFMGVFDIYKESYKIILTCRQIFSKITLSLILPLSFIFLAHIQISDLIFSDIIHDENQLDQTRDGSSANRKKLNDLISSEWTLYWLFKVAYFTFFLIFSLLSTAAVVYTVASIYTGRDITFPKIMSVVPKVWKRLMVTFLCVFAALFAYNFVAIIVFIFVAIMIFSTDGRFQTVMIFGFFAFYFAGMVYLSIVFQLGSVVSVLEDDCGFKAMVKSRGLIRGKMWISGFIFFKLNLSLYLIQFAFEKLVVHGSNLGMVSRVIYGIICFLLIFKLFLFGLVIQTVIYFVCKSFHHENIDKSALSDHLEVYLLGEYVPLKAKDVQLEQFDV